MLALPNVSVTGEVVRLPLPRESGGTPLFRALRERQSSRTFSERDLAPDDLSGLLWAAFGMNRPDGHRTAPSAHDCQEIDVYAALRQGLYVFDPHDHALRQVHAYDIRGETGQQDYVATAPLNLIYVADLSRMKALDRTEQRFYSAIDAGFISENVYLFCASEGLATVVRGLIDRRALAKRMKLRPQQRIIVAQCVGYPAQ